MMRAFCRTCDQCARVIMDLHGVPDNDEYISMCSKDFCCKKCLDVYTGEDGEAELVKGNIREHEHYYLVDKKTKQRIF